MNNPDEERGTAISAWKATAELDVDTTASVEQTAHQFKVLGLKTMDALHLASAIEAKADRFLTTDKGILSKMRLEPRISVLDPIDFIREMDEGSDEE
ncbi:MAG: hypothetical protein R3C09_11595 [Pirellulaceae bacterium]